MGALSNPKLEVFARELAKNIAMGQPRTVAQQNAARVAGYSGSSGSFAANARKFAAKSEVKRRLAELFAPKIAEAECDMRATKQFAIEKLMAIAVPDLGESKIKIPDQLMALKQLAELNGWKAPEQSEVVGAVQMAVITGKKRAPDEI